MIHTPLLGERSPTLIGADFPNRATAVTAAHILRKDPTVDAEVDVLSPDDPRAVDKMEPEDQGIWQTAIRSHLILGSLGMLGGGAATAAVILIGWQAAVASPWFALLFFSVLGTIFGMLLAGLITMRPDHSIVIRKIEAALRRHRWAVIVHPHSEQPAQAAMAVLRRCGAHPSRSL